MPESPDDNQPSTNETELQSPQLLPIGQGIRTIRFWYRDNKDTLPPEDIIWGRVENIIILLMDASDTAPTLEEIVFALWEKDESMGRDKTAIVRVFYALTGLDAMRRLTIAPDPEIWSKYRRGNSNG